MISSFASELHSANAYPNGAGTSHAVLSASLSNTNTSTILNSQGRQFTALLSNNRFPLSQSQNIIYLKDLANTAMAKDAKGNKKTKSSQVQLTILREMCLVLSPHMVLDDELVNLLLWTIIEAPDNSVDRKVIRTCFYLISEIMSSAMNVLNIHTGKQQHLGAINIAKLFSAIQDEIKVQIGIRECHGWRLLGRLAKFGNKSSTTASQEEMELFCINGFQNLKYPTKQQKSIFSLG
jgi:hypothetical protein